MITASASHVARALVLVPVVLLQVGWLARPLPLAVRLLHLTILAVSLARPVGGLLVLVALTPFARSLAALTACPYPAPRLLEQIVLAGMTGALLRASANAPTRIGFPAALLAIVASASAAVTVVPGLAAVAPGASIGSLAQAFWQTGYFEMAAEWEPVSLGLLTVEAAVLAWTVERHVRSEPDVAEQVVRMALVAACGAATASILRIVAGALRSPEFFANAARLLSSVRVSVLADVNAAASMLLLPLLGGVGLLVRSRRWLLYGAMLALAAAGLWLTGSRVALASVGAIALLQAFRMLRAGSATSRLAGAAAVAGLAVAAVAAFVLYPAARNMDVSRSVQARFTLAKAGLTMVQSAPVWGVGIGRFDDESARLVGGEIARLLGEMSDGRLYDRENAHNNFLQVLAEQGLVGLGALLFLIGSTCHAAARADRDAAEPLRRWILYAVAACLLTWLTGHPLLVPEFVLMFFVFLGLLSALTPLPRWRVQPWAAWTMAAVILMTVPWRASSALRSAELEHIGAGLSVWQHDDVRPYRRGGRTSSLYVPATETAAVPVRREPGAPDPLALEVRRDGRLIASLFVGGDRWTVVRLPHRGEPRRFVLIEFTIANAPEGAAATTSLIRVGRPTGAE